MAGRSLKVFVTGNSPRSLKKISEFNWSGYALYGTRDQINQLLERSEAQNSGIYFLLSGLNTEITKMYIGETECFADRIKQHCNSKDWWTHFIVFQSQGSALNKAHIKYLEYSLWNRAKLSPQIELSNSANLSMPNLAEEDKSDLEKFEENILFILEAMDLGFFQHRNLSSSSENAQVYVTKVPNSDLMAQMVISDQTFYLKAGSYIKATPRDSFETNNSGYFNVWKNLIESNQVEKYDKETYKLLSDIEFTSSSAAGAIVHAGACNGLTVWKNKSTNKTLKEELLTTETNRN